MTRTPASPGSHSHQDRKNWRPAENFGEYVQNCRDGLESYSDRRAAKLLGWSRIRLYRARLMAEIPADLFDALLANPNGLPSTRELAQIAQALKGEGPATDAEHCPHCGELLRLRRRWRRSTAEIVNTWLRERAP